MLQERPVRQHRRGDAIGAHLFLAAKARAAPAGGYSEQRRWKEGEAPRERANWLRAPALPLHAWQAGGSRLQTWALMRTWAM